MQRNHVSGVLQTMLRYSTYTNAPLDPWQQMLSK